jgi:DNA-directed RNA polymerase subunit RPC12/RpoP
MKSNLCFFCSKKFDKHTKDELLECASEIIKGVSET